MPRKMRIEGKIKAITFKGEKVSILLENARYLSKEGNWETVDPRDSKLRMGELWMSAFENSAPQVYQACRRFDEDDASMNIQKGAEVEADIYKPHADKPFWNMNSIGLKMPEVDVNEDMPPDAPEMEERMFPEEPSSDQRPEDSPEARAQRLAESTTLDMKYDTKLVATDKDIQIIRQTCIKAVGYALNIKTPEELNAFILDVVASAKRLEKYVLEGK